MTSSSHPRVTLGFFFVMSLWLDQFCFLSHRISSHLDWLLFNTRIFLKTFLPLVNQEVKCKICWYTWSENSWVSKDFPQLWSKVFGVDRFIWSTVVSRCPWGICSRTPHLHDPQIPKSMNSQILDIRWHSICM